MSQSLLKYIPLKLAFLCLWFVLSLLLQSTSFAQEKRISETSEKQSVDSPQDSQAVNSTEALKEPVDLSMFIKSVLRLNTELRKNNSQKLFERLVNKKETGLLPIEVFKSLGFRLRDPFLVQTPEVSTRFYTIADDSNLYFQELFDLEKTWALLSTTFSRVSQNDSFFSLIEQNVALDSVDLWYRMTNNQQYNQWINELKDQIKIAGRNIELNKDEFSESSFGKMKIKNLELFADNTQLIQFFDTEAAYLFTRSGARSLPENRKNPIYNFSQQVLCSPNIELLEVGNSYLKTNNPDVLKELKNKSLKQKIWQLLQSAREFSKRLLLEPQNQQLKAVNYVLSDFTLSLILQLNHERLNAYAENQSKFFAEQSNNSFPYESSSRLTEFINFQNEIYGLKVLDAFVAAERVASLNLQLFRGCIQLYDDQKSTKLFAQTAETQRFVSLNFPAATNVTGAINQLVKRWDGSNYSIIGASAEQEPIVDASAEQEPIIGASAEQEPIVDASAEQEPIIGASTEQEPIVDASAEQESIVDASAEQDSIVGASAEQAANLLKNAGFVLSSYDEIIELTNVRGYSIQVLTTSSASEAAEKARRMTEIGDVRVYLSSVNVNGVIEGRYKVLVLFQTGQLSEAKYAEFSSKANQIRGYVKRYKQIRNDVKVPDSIVSKPKPKPKPKPKEATRQSLATQSVENKAVVTAQIQPAQPDQTKPDSIIAASSEQAAILLQKAGFTLSSYDQMIELTNEIGYSIQVITTSSASEAARKARRLSKTEEVKVYLSSVEINGIVEKRYKVLVSFFEGLAEPQKFEELKVEAQKLKGFVKRYKNIRKDLIR